MTTPTTLSRIRQSVEEGRYPFYPFLLVRDWLHEARSGVIRLPRRSTFLTFKAYRRQQHNCIDIGRDYQRGLDRRTTQPLTTALKQKGA